jgi:adenosylcobinamide-phosphate synthase
VVRTTLAKNALGVALGLMSDLAFGEPRIDPHPLSVFGSFMRRSENTLYGDHRSAGVLHTLVGAGVGIGCGLIVRSIAAATYLSVAPVALMDAARDISRALDEEDLLMARALLPTLVGRDPTSLDASEISRAVVESLAENMVDAVVAPALWGVIGGAVGTLTYRAVNTMDAMVGYRNERYLNFGWASARLDDVANFIPARLTAAMVVLVRPRATRTVWETVRRDAPGHPSPNAGVAEAAFAAALGVRLGGTNRYGAVVEERVALGAGRRPERSDIDAAIALCRDVTWTMMLVLALVGLVAS